MLRTIRAFINDRYGSKAGCLEHWRHRALHGLGRYRQLLAIDWPRVERLVFLCNGNICRSPLAEAVARAQGVPAVSVGLNCTPGAPADPRALRFAEAQGLDLNGHGATPVSLATFAQGDLLIAMTPRQLAHPRVKALADVQKTLLGLWLSPPQPYIPDPYSASEAYFQRCETNVLQATRQLLSSARPARQAWRTSTR